MQSYFLYILVPITILNFICAIHPDNADRALSLISAFSGIIIAVILALTKIATIAEPLIIKIKELIYKVKETEENKEDEETRI